MSFGSLVFTPAVKMLQERYGSRRAYARMECASPSEQRIGPAETESPPATQLNRSRRSCAPWKSGSACSSARTRSCVSSAMHPRARSERLPSS